MYARVYECERYDGDDLLTALNGIPLAVEVTIDDLIEIGWYHRNEVIITKTDIMETNYEV